MLGRIIKNLVFSGVMIGLVGLITGVTLLITGQRPSAFFYLTVGIVFFVWSFLTAIYYHNRDVHVEPWGAFLGTGVLVTLFILEFVFFPLLFAIGVVISTLTIIFLYAFICRKIHKTKQKKQ